MVILMSSAASCSMTQINIMSSRFRLQKFKHRKTDFKNHSTRFKYNIKEKMTEFRKYLGEKREKKTSYLTNPRRDIPEFLGSRTEHQRKNDRKTIYDDHQKTVRVNELLDTVTERELKELFSDFGEVMQVKVPRTHDRTTDEWVGRGFAFITFFDAETAREALRYNRLLWNHTRIQVKISQPPRRNY